MGIKKLVIVGGVAGGATAAARARRLDETVEIVVLERGPHISFANCGLPYHIGGDIAVRDDLLLQTPDSLRARYNIDVRINSEVTAIDREKKEVTVKDRTTGSDYVETYDKLILAPGATPVRPNLPGLDSDRVLVLRNMQDLDTIKKVLDSGISNALVVGGGFIGLEMVENLAGRGVKVDLVEMLEQVMPPLDPEMASPIHDQLTSNGVGLYLGKAVQKFEQVDGRVMSTLSSGEHLTSDLVILSIGVTPESILAVNCGLETALRGGIKVNKHMQTSDPNVYAVGDAVVVTDWVTKNDTLLPLAGPANRQARIAVDNVFARASTYRGSQGTGVVAVFDLTVAMTGANEKTLIREGIEFEKVYIHPDHHVTYYPNAEKLAIKLLFSRPDGRILGAQIVGKQGVDKRLDVLALAIQAGMTVYDLEEAELGYAPQYGAAKDPINMAGFVGANTLRGDVKNVHANQLNGGTILDIRDDDELEVGIIPGATQIPLPLLRQRHEELSKTDPIYVYCQVGLRGYIAARILSQLGYDVHNISGGFLTYKMFFPDNGGVNAVGTG